MMNSKYDEHMRAKEIRKKLGVKTFESTIRVRRLNYIQRLENGIRDNIARHVISLKCVDDTPKIGQPFNNWNNTALQDVIWAANCWRLEPNISNILVKNLTVNNTTGFSMSNN